MISSTGILLRKAIVLFGLSALVLPAMAQQKSSFKVSGPGMGCGASRVEGLTKGLKGVNSASYNANSSMLTVDFNPGMASLVDIQLELSLQGYDAGDFGHDAKFKSPCGGAMRGDQAVDDLDEPGIDDIEGLEDDTDWENPNNVDLGGTASSEDIDMLLDDEDDDADLIDWADGSDGDADFDEEDEDDDDL